MERRDKRPSGSREPVVGKASESPGQRGELSERALKKKKKNRCCLGPERVTTVYACFGSCSVEKEKKVEGIILDCTGMLDGCVFFRFDRRIVAEAEGVVLLYSYHRGASVSGT